jgi:hypothetical protein
MKENPVRSRFLLLTLCIYLAFAVFGCSRKPSTDASPDSSGANTQNATTQTPNDNAPEPAAAQVPSRPEPLVVPAGTAVTVSLASAIGSKLSQAGDAFDGSVARDVRAGGVVVIPRGTRVRGTVVEAKPLGRFAGGAELQVRLDSIRLKGSELPVRAALQTFTAKGKGKRTALMTGGGAALGGIIGGLAGGGKGAAIGLAAGGGAGAGGAAFTGNKDIVLPAESTVSFQLSHSLEVRQ